MAMSSKDRTIQQIKLIIRQNGCQLDTHEKFIRQPSMHAHVSKTCARSSPRACKHRDDRLWDHGHEDENSISTSDAELGESFGES
eukprot:6177851-Pleurochrysis_carterae.AAC.3